MRVVDVTVTIQNAWEVQEWRVPDDAPEPITQEWFEANMEDCEMLGVEESGGLYEITGVEDH